MCTVKLDRAQKLIAGLGGEKSRWTAVAARLGQQFLALTGDIVLAAAQIAYLGGHPDDLSIVNACMRLCHCGLVCFAAGRSVALCELSCAKKAVVLCMHQQLSKLLHVAVE